MSGLAGETAALNCSDGRDVNVFVFEGRRKVDDLEVG